MRSLTVYFVLFLVSVCGVSAQEYVPTPEDTADVYAELFSREDPLHLSLKVDLKKFRRDRRKEEYQDAELTCSVNDQFQITNPVRIMARGEFRRDNCNFPPFWLNIRHSGITSDSLRDMEVNRMKMVVRCRPASTYENYVLREFLVYKIYNIITPYSYRVRLCRLKLIDTSKNNQEREDWAFIQEPDEVMGPRLNGAMYKGNQLSMRSVNPEIMDLMALFCYMIANGDYSVRGRHNLKILTVRPPGPAGFLPVPYDFDYTGLVNTHYAIPGETLGIRTVRERYFLGPCRSKPVMLETIKKLASHKEEIYECINGFEYLPEKERADMVAYLETYYEEAALESFFERRLDPTCR